MYDYKLFAARKQEILEKVKACFDKAEHSYSVKIANLNIRFDLKGRCAGTASHRYGAYELRFNQQMMLNEGWDNLLNDTVPHEVAHIVCFANPDCGRNHDYGWKSVCRMLGGSGDRCHTEEVEYAHGTVYYISTTGTVIPVSKQRHTKIQRGAAYNFRDGKGRLSRECQYSTRKPGTAAPAPVAPTTQVAPVTRAITPVAAPVASVGTSKADKVRAKIAEYKADHGSEAYEMVIRWAIANLNMTYSLAKAYVSGNWDKA